MARERALGRPTDLDQGEAAALLRRYALAARARGP
jgi:hypothetical protein